MVWRVCWRCFNCYILYQFILVFLILYLMYNAGFRFGEKGCCGTGDIEVAILCNPASHTCTNVSDYVFWDSYHPTEGAYKALIPPLLQKYINSFFWDNNGPSQISSRWILPLLLILIGPFSHVLTFCFFWISPSGHILKFNGDCWLFIHLERIISPIVSKGGHDFPTKILWYVRY